MQLNLKINVPTGLKPKEATGLLVSLISGVEEIAKGEKRASYLNHFWRERLTRSERRLLSILLGNLYSSLLKLQDSYSPTPLRESLLDTKIPDCVAKIIQSFRDI